MSKGVKGFYVALEYDISEESSKKISNAIRMMKSVIDVKSIESSHEDWLIERRIKDEIRKKAFDFIKKEL